MTRGAVGGGGKGLWGWICMGREGVVMGEVGGVGVVRAPSARSGGGVVGAAEGARRVLHGSRLVQNEACARTRTKARENGEGGGKGRGDGRRRSLEGGATVGAGGGRREGERAREWAGPGRAPRREAKI